uniref:Secretory carrier-associated membrane protein n=1 Tax=Serinus canaria TaxID=9135 RepID=A0A8C9N2L5_SERCA
FAGRKNNWPPLPENFPVGPCFYQDFSVDIPVEFQKTVKIMYYLWMCKYFILKKSEDLGFPRIPSTKHY